MKDKINLDDPANVEWRKKLADLIEEHILPEINPLYGRVKELEATFKIIKMWAEEELKESSMIADAKYEEVMAGKDEAYEMNYYAGARDKLKELLEILGGDEDKAKET